MRKELEELLPSFERQANFLAKPELREMLSISRSHYKQHLVDIMCWVAREIDPERYAEDGIKIEKDETLK